ncbi:ATP-binding protein [Candidatus Pacearchaeota archaeon]|nr:ATP-binding protein [Candidatus Pacearchaeota archaeon]
MEIVFPIGLPGSGKSHHVDEHLKFSHQVICPDDVRKSLGFEYNLRTEPVVLMTCDVMARAYLERNLDIVIDATNLHLGLMDKYLRIANEYGYETEAVIIDTPIETCIERRSKKWNKETIQKVFHDKMIPLWNDLKRNDFAIIELRFDKVTVI